MSYRTIKERVSAEIVEKKSRFIAQMAPVESEDEALAFLEEIRSLHRMARHNAYAYVLLDGRVRYSDDGEPSQTAGLPTLEVITHAELKNVAVVTTRYFGGTLLGTGGLVRAYTEACRAAVDAAEIVVMSDCVDLGFTIDYGLYDQVIHLLEACGGKVLESTFAERVDLRVRFLVGDEESFVGHLAELTRGSCPVEMSDPHEAPW